MLSEDHQQAVHHNENCYYSTETSASTIQNQVAAECTSFTAMLLVHTHTCTGGQQSHPRTRV